MNTIIDYLYTDASNYKKRNRCVVIGEITEEMRDTILDCLSEEQFFIPSQVGLPETRFDDGITVDDHCWFSLDDTSFLVMDVPNTVQVTVHDLVAAFVAHKDNWDDSGPTDRHVVKQKEKQFTKEEKKIMSKRFVLAVYDPAIPYSDDIYNSGRYEDQIIYRRETDSFSGLMRAWNHALKKYEGYTYCVRDTLSSDIPHLNIMVGGTFSPTDDEILHANHSAVEQHTLWDSEIDMSDWEEDLREQYPDESEDALWRIADETNTSYLEDVKYEVKRIRIPNGILGIGSLGLWNGRRPGFREVDSIESCFRSHVNGQSNLRIYLDSMGDLCVREGHHDGTNYYKFRAWKPNVSDSSKERLTDLIYSGEEYDDLLKKLTYRLGDLIGDIYGWKFPNRPKAAGKAGA